MAYLPTCQPTRSPCSCRGHTRRTGSIRITFRATLSTGEEGIFTGSGQLWASRPTVGSLHVIDPQRQLKHALLHEHRIAVTLAVDLEIMKVRVGPAHCRLDVFVQFVERAVPTD